MTGFEDQPVFEKVPLKVTPKEARDHHYNRHSRTMPIGQCNQPECRKAVRRAATGR